MIKADEMLFTVDENNTPTQPMKRKDVHALGIWHRVSHIWIVNNNEMLIQQRSLIKDTSPGLWESFFGGHIPTGKSPELSATEELHEELGLQVKITDLSFFKTFKNNTSKEFVYIFTHHTSKSTSEMKIETEEIQTIQWQQIDVVKNNILDSSNREWSHPGYEKIMIEHILSQAS